MFWAINMFQKHMSLYVSIICFCVLKLSQPAQLNHITTLTRMLANIRKAYLNVDARNPPVSRQISSKTIDLAGPDQSWSGIRSLTNEERDQIDLQARVILSRCAD